MILVFQDDCVVRLVEDEAEANIEFEAIDARDSLTFVSPDGFLMKPRFSAEIEGRFLGAKTVKCVPYSLERTQFRRKDLIEALLRGDYEIQVGGRQIVTLADLLKIIPEIQNEN